ncbi:hypothetical protein ACFQ9X_41660 [Catenulispora yoronensis]
MRLKRSGAGSGVGTGPGFGSGAGSRALALSWRAAPLDTTLELATTVAMGLIPAAGAWTGKLLFDELARGRAMDPAARAGWW